MTRSLLPFSASLRLHPLAWSSKHRFHNSNGGKGVRTGKEGNGFSWGCRLLIIDLVFACVRQLYVWTFGGRRNLEQVGTGTGTGTGTLQTSEEHTYLTNTSSGIFSQFSSITAWTCSHSLADGEKIKS
ncbi:hypothetical protein R3P38DRAFT_2834240 [Favolaschia claudopus]|uniref:Uncharacterized protein n=1 Tax=Favolaschia claudopus TaxID=2862362 RepID=A0AAW0EFU2_9AGAR